MIDEKKLIENIETNKLLARESATVRCIEYINNQPQVQKIVRTPKEITDVLNLHRLLCNDCGLRGTCEEKTMNACAQHWTDWLEGKVDGTK